MKVLKYSLGVILSGFMFSGCVGQPSIAEIDDNEAFKYIKQYEAEYQQLKANSPKAEMPVKWIQAANKKEPCKLYVGYNPNDDRTLKDGYKIFWDGNCKNGYASGLGREFERGFLTNLDAIALYNGEEKKPEYFIQKDNLKNITREGDINNGNFQEIEIKDDVINYAYGHKARNNTYIDLAILSSTSFKKVMYLKKYSNFYYLIEDFSNDKFNSSNTNYNTHDAKGKGNGFSFSVGKDNIRYSGEVINNQLVRRVKLPQSYHIHMDNILSEIESAGKVAKDAQEKALMVKKQYKYTICKDNIKVDFIDNNEYKAICNEEKEAELKKKIDAQKEQQQNEQRLIQAREAEAAAAQAQVQAIQEANKQRAKAAEKADNQRAIQNLSNSIDNINKQNQNMYNNTMNIMNNNNQQNNSDKKYNYIHQMAPNLYYVK